MKLKLGQKHFLFVLLINALLFTPTISQAKPPALEFVREIGVPFGSGWMSFVTFSPDGTKIASDGPAQSGDKSRSLSVWSFPEGRLIKQLPEPIITLSDDWKYFVSKKGVRDMESGDVLLSLPASGENFLKNYTFSPDSHYVAQSSFIFGKKTPDRSHIRILELPTGKQVSAFASQNVFSTAINADNTTLASGHWDTVILWNMLTGKRLASLRGIGRYVENLSFSPNGKWLAVGTDAGDLQIWDVARRKRIRSFGISAGQVSKPAFSPDGRLIAVGVYGTGTAWLFDIKKGKLLAQPQVSDLGCGSVAFSPDGRYLIMPSTGGLIKWPYDYGGTVRVFKINAP